MDLSIQYKKPESNITWDTNTTIVGSQDRSEIKQFNVSNNFNDMFERIFILNKLNDYDSWYNIINTINQKSINIKYYSRHPLISEKNETILKQYNNHQRKYNKISTLKEYIFIKSLGDIIKLAEKNNNKSILVLLDTVHFHQNANKLIGTIKQRIANNWDLLYLGATQTQLKPVTNNILYKANPYTKGNFALAIKSNLFKLFLNFIETLDKSFEDFMINIKKNYRVFVSNPNLVINTEIKVSPTTTNWNLENYTTHLVRNVNPLISVIMTSHNSEKWIQYSIESILQQTYKNIELIVIDDNSQDKTVDIIKQFLDIDNRVRLIENGDNYGTYISKNIGIKHSNGQYITFQDSDDYSMLNRLQLQLSQLKNNKWKVCYGKYLAKNNEMSFCEITMFMRRDCIDYIGYFDSVRFGADTEFRMRMTTLNIPICYMEKYIYTRLDRIMEGNGIGNLNSLTNSKKTSVNSTIRYIYRQSFQCYHKVLKTKRALKEKLYYVDFPQEKRPFEILYNNQIDKNILEAKLSSIDNYLYKVKL